MAKSTRKSPTFRIEPLIEFFGEKQVLAATLKKTGAKKVLEELGPKKVLEELGPKKVLEQMDLDQLLANIPPDKLRELKRRLTQV
jgi:hypothetical protein